MQLQEQKPITRPDLQTAYRNGLETEEQPVGEAAAAILAAGVGAFAMGLMTTLAEAFEGFRTFLNVYNPVGPRSGNSLGAIVIWVFSWAVLFFLWKCKDIPFSRVFTATVILIALGVLGTFPIFFDLFAP
jgi:hypothetical protein